MNFLKQNLFLVCTLGVVLVVGGVLLALAGPARKEARSYVEVRTQLSAQLASLTRGEMAGTRRVRINKKVVEAARNRVIKTRQEYAEVVKRALARNRAHYQVMSFPDPDDPKAPPLRAFPVEPKLYQRKGLRLLFPDEYRKRVLALLASMRPTAPPTPEEIKEQADLIAEKEQLKAGTERLPGTAAPAPTTPATPPSSRYLVGRPPPRIGPGPEAGLAAPAGQQGRGQVPMTPEEKARLTLMLAKAQLGDIYADASSMHMALVSSRVNYTNDMLWMAQVSLWVQRDIVAAINRTNREVIQRRELSGRKGGKGVPASAVKRLRKIELLGYVVRPSAGRGAAAGDASHAAGERPPVPGRIAGMRPALGAAGQLMLIGGLGSGGGAGLGMAAAQGRAAGLTQRACNTLYDVVQYRFCVVVSSSELLRLYRNLLFQNYHTILDVRVGKPDRSQGRGMERTGPIGPTELYYYGTDPVVEATITGELLLLADWTRGRKDPKTNEWQKDYPPLMPLEFLHLIAQADPTALRPEDNDRLGGTRGEVTPVGRGPGGSVRP